MRYYKIGKFKFTSDDVSTAIVLLVTLAIVIGSVGMAVYNRMAQMGCLEYGYPRSYATLGREIYCIRTVNMSDETILLSALKGTDR